MMDTKVDTKNRIIDAAIDLFAEKGYLGTSMRNIAEAVQVKPSSIYNHFTSKEEIFDTIFDEYQSLSYEHVVQPDNLEGMDARDALEKMFYTFEPESAVRMTKILKIIMSEQFRVQKAHEFIRDNMYHGIYGYLKSVMDKLVALHKIRPINSSVYAKLFLSLLLASSVEVMHFSDDEMRYMRWDREDNPMDFLIDQIVGP